MEEPNPPENRNINTGGGSYSERIEGDYIQGNVFQNIVNIFGGHTAIPVGNPTRPKNQRILLAAVKEEITARLRQSLHNAVPINLGKESQPQQVKRPWDADIKIGQKPPEPLPDTTTILEVFDSEEIAGKLLILGAPGSGKTTAQLKLAQTLVSRAEEQPDYPVPALFNLSSWKDNRQSISDWLVTELKSKYDVSKKLGQQWVNNHQLLPLLDGLDELEPQRQEICVHAINQFLASETRPLYLVVCSRIEEYSNYSSNLHLNGAICLRELNEIQISEYFEAVGRVEFWQTLQQDETLLKLMRTPLFLSITVLSVQELSIEDWQRLENMEARIEHLFDAHWRQQIFNRDHAKELYVIKNRLRFFLDKYIRRLSVEPGIKPYIQHKPPIPKQTKLWLIWLAQQMQRESKTEFLIEEMQPDWLKNRGQKIIDNLIVWVVISTLIFEGIGNGFFGGISGGISGRIYEVILGLISGLISGDMGKLIENKIEKIKLISSLINFRITTIKLLILWMISGVIWGIFLGIPNGISGVIYVGISGGIYGGIVGGILGMIGNDIQPVEKLNFSIKKFFNIMILGIILGIILSVIFWWKDWVIIGVTFGGTFGLMLAINGREIEKKTIPNQGIRQSVTNTILILAVFCLLATLLIFIFLEEGLEKNKLEMYLISSLVRGFFIGLLIAIPRSGTPVIKHFVLRIVLWSNGYIPWNYARFLDYCTERLFLQRVGGRYRFMHKLLQEHFAQMPFDRIVD
jgi:DNA polymerase III delta prime subunit